jgi:hypothetical protein
MYQNYYCSRKVFARKQSGQKRGKINSKFYIGMLLRTDGVNKKPAFKINIYELRPFGESEYLEKGILTVPNSCFISAAPRSITVSFPFRFTMGDDGSQQNHEDPLSCGPNQ